MRLMTRTLRWMKNIFTFAIYSSYPTANLCLMQDGPKQAGQYVAYNFGLLSSVQGKRGKDKDCHYNHLSISDTFTCLQTLCDNCNTVGRLNLHMRRRSKRSKLGRQREQQKLHLSL